MASLRNASMSSKSYQKKQDFTILKSYYRGCV